MASAPVVRSGTRPGGDSDVTCTPPAVATFVGGLDDAMKTTILSLIPAEAPLPMAGFDCMVYDRAGNRRHVGSVRGYCHRRRSVRRLLVDSLPFEPKRLKCVRRSKKPPHGLELRWEGSRAWEAPTDPLYEIELHEGRDVKLNVMHRVRRGEPGKKIKPRAVLRNDRNARLVFPRPVAGVRSVTVGVRERTKLARVVPVSSKFAMLAVRSFGVVLDRVTTVVACYGAVKFVWHVCLPHQKLASRAAPGPRLLAPPPRAFDRAVAALCAETGAVAVGARHKRRLEDHEERIRRKKRARGGVKPP